MGLKVTKQHEGNEEGGNLLSNDEETNEMIETDFTEEIRALDFSTILQQSLPFNDPFLERLIPGCRIILSVEDNFFKNRRSWYLLEVQHGCFRWHLLKRFKDIFKLHEKLLIYRTILSIQIPELKLKREKGRRISSVVFQTKKIPKLPSFPLNLQTITHKNDIEWKKEVMQKYLQNILDIDCFREYHETLEFLEIGPYSFIEDLGSKGKEGFVRRRSDCGENRLGMMCSTACGFWKKRWLFSKENFLSLVDPSRGDIEFVILLDKAFQTKAGRRSTGRSDILIIRNLNRKLVLQCESGIQASEWAEELSLGLERGSADFVTPNRYLSFAPPRSPSECKWIIDGATYFEAVAIAMDAAKEEIFIADWWLSPEIYLKRPTIHGHYWQLDYLLRRKAREGVRIYVLLYKELELALGINSLHTEQKLSTMHPNIQVLRHPYVSKGVLFWAHHEKIVCVDQTHAFIGGIDLCYGRWDDFQHRLTDIGEIEEKLRIERHMSTVPQVLEMLSDLSNISGDEEETEKLKQKRFDETSFPMQMNQMDNVIQEKTYEGKPSKIPTVGGKLKGAVRKIQARKMFDDIKKQLSSERKRQERGSIIPYSPDQPGDIHRIVQELTFRHLGTERNFRLWHGKDYVNFINKDFEKLHQPYSDMINRNTTPRMPWHDVGFYTYGMVARDIARHFILRWNHAKEENCLKDSLKPYLMPKCYSTLQDTASDMLLKTVGTLYKAECQVLRSLCSWSGNISDTENSIHNAYLTVIREAKQFIYIENQFFISQPAGSSSVYNGIADALFNRILKAHRERKQFRVYIVLPLLPAFEGEVGTGSGILIQTITHWNYKSICRGSSSLYERLARHVKDPSKYIGFYGLRTHSILANKPVTELIYVHSKILIADDQVAIIGSANINDRSLLGRRDSEIAVIVRDTKFLDEPHEAGQFCFTLRRALFREHLGLMEQKAREIDLRHPGSMDFYHVWNDIASRNTRIYEKVFRCLPTDDVRTFSDLKKRLNSCNLADVNPDAAQKELEDIQGYLVQFPLFFFCDEKLEPHLTSKEHYLPYSIFT